MDNPTRDEIHQATDTLVRAIVDLITTREEVRQAVGTILRRVMEPTPVTPGTLPTPAQSSTPTPGTPTPEKPIPLIETTLSLGDSRAALEVPHSRGQAVLPPTLPRDTREVDREDFYQDRGVDPPDLSIIAQRARLKAESCDWAIDLRELIENDADHRSEISPTDTRLIGQARSLPDCYLWMLHPYHELPSDELLENLAGCYENVVLAAELAERIIEGRDPGGREGRPPLDLLYLIAEAQSALFAGLDQAGMFKDRDQLDLFKWLGDKTYAHRIFIKSHMKRDDPADYTNWEDLGDRLESYVEQKTEQAGRERDRGQLLNKLNYHLHRLADTDDDETSHQWAKILETLTDWVQAGFPPSDREIRILLLPVLDDLPDTTGITDEAQRVLDAIDRYLSDLENTEPDLTPVRSLPEEVMRVAELLRGKVVVLVGGERRPHAKANLERDLELAELRWLPIRDHQALSTLEPEIGREDVALVLLAIRWSNHMHGDLKPIADTHGKPFVRLPRGYGSSQVAHEVLSQVSEQLTPTPRIAPAPG